MLEEKTDTFKPALEKILDYEEESVTQNSFIEFKAFPTEFIQGEWMEQCRKAIQDFIGEENCQTFNLQLTPLDYNNTQFVITLPIHHIAGLCSISMDIQFDDDSILCLSYYTKTDQTPIYASNKNIINQLTYVALKFNSEPQIGAVFINPQTGLFCYKTFTQFSRLEQQTCSSQQLREFFYTQYLAHKEIMSRLAPKILYLLNKITNKQYQYCREHLLQETKDFQEIDDKKEEQFKYKDEKYLEEIKDIIENKCLTLMEDQVDEQLFKGIPKPKNLPILTQINTQINSKDDPEALLNDWKKNQQPIATGGYAEIRKVQITYKSGDALQKRFLAVKTDQIEKIAAENEKKKKNNSIEQETVDHKVNHELLILKHLANGNYKKRGEGFIATSYYDPKIDRCYFMEFYNNGSLDSYMAAKNIVFSLRTKLFILAGIIQGIEFMHNNGIAHLDLKLGNILVQKQLMPKICDFGEAQFIQKIKKNKLEYSYSIPYSAPELFNNELITEAFDIFSFGVLMCQLIFEQSPFEYNPQDPTSLEERFRKNTYAIKRNLASQIKQGPKKIIKNIVKLIFLCLQSKPDVRPKPSWLIIVLWKMINYIDCF